MLLSQNKKLEPYILTCVNVLARMSHLLFYLAIGNQFGASSIIDRVVFLQTPLFVLMAVIAGTADVVVMPTFHRAENLDTAKFLSRYAVKRVLYIVLPGSGLLLCFFSFLQNSFDWILLCILLPLPMFGSLAALKSGVLNASNRFRVALLGPLVGGLLTVPFVLLVEPGLYSLAASFLLFEFGKFIGLFFFRDITKGGCSSRSIGAEKLVQWASGNAIWQIAGSTILAMVLVVDVLFAKTLGEGSVSFVEYGNKLWNIIPLLFVGHITMIYTALSKSASEGLCGDSRKIHSAALYLGFIAVLLSMVVIFFSHHIIGIIYGVGAFTPEDQDRLANLLRYYLIGAGPYVSSLVYVRAFSAVGRVQALTFVACVGLLLNIICDYLLIDSLGMNGIGLATSLVYGLNALMLAVLYKYSVKKEQYEV